MYSPYGTNINVFEDTIHNNSDRIKDLEQSDIDIKNDLLACKVKIDELNKSLYNVRVQFASYAVINVIVIILMACYMYLN